MANPRWDWDTGSNKAAEGSAAARSMDMPEDGVRSDDDWMRLVSSAASEGENHISSNLRQRWARSYKAFQNEHFDGAKYNTKRYAGRSKLFRPKSRAAVRRNDAAAAASLFATSDVVQITPENDADPLQQSGAAVLHALVNMRLDRSSTTFGIPWFLVSIGARQDSQITGICASKQYWEYEQVVTGYRQVETVDPVTGALGIMDEPIVETRKDRPWIRLYPADHVLRDPSADWLDQAQSGSYLILKNPMSLGDLKAMMRHGTDKNSAVRWREADDAELRRGIDEQNNNGVRRAREGTGTDRLEDAHNTVDEFATVWVYEVFVRLDGEDWCFWTMGKSIMLSDPVPVQDAYPEHNGRRPVVIGVGALESHKIDPLSPVESWQPLQQEANDVTNLRLDNVKQNMSPVTKVRRGKRVDIAQVQNRSPDSVIFVDNLEDVEWDRPPDVSGSAYAEMDRINVDFDELAGSFSPGSVQSNRQLNETVGGMRLLSSAANSVAEYDLRVWVETWVEPVLRQMVSLEAYYETDPRILTIAGQKAQVWEQWRVSNINDQLLMQPVNVRVNVGIGASDPMQRLEKFSMATQTVTAILGPQVVQTAIDREAVIEEVFGAAGYKDGARFFPNLAGQGEMFEQMMATIQDLQRQLADKEADRQNKIEVERIRSATDLIEQKLENENRGLDRAAQEKAGRMQMFAKAQSDRARLMSGSGSGTRR